MTLDNIRVDSDNWTLITSSASTIQCLEGGCSVVYGDEPDSTVRASAIGHRIKDDINDSSIANETAIDTYARAYKVDKVAVLAVTEY